MKGNVDTTFGSMLKDLILIRLSMVLEVWGYRDLAPTPYVYDGWLHNMPL